MKKGFTKQWLYCLIAIFIALLMIGCSNDVEPSGTSIVPPADTTAPVIESQQEIFSLTENDATGEYLVSLTAYDEIDGDLTGKIEIDDSKVKYGQVGTYQIVATVVDSSENKCTQSFDVVIKDTTAPTLSLTKTSFTLTAGDSAPNYKSIATANDNVDGEITSSIAIDSSKVNYNSVGTYEVTYTATDSSGNVTIQKVTVTIKAKATSSNSSSNAGSNSSSGSAQVMITRTGECYHKRKCGNGTYFWVTLQEAKNRGLRACQKCY